VKSKESAVPQSTACHLPGLLRRGRLGLLALCAAAVGLCAVSSTASAVELHGLEFAIDGSGSANGAFSDLGGVAIHQPTGTVYAVDRDAGGIDKFDASGTPQDFSALGANFIDVEATCPNFMFPPKPNKEGIYEGLYHGRDGIAVSSAGPTAGTIYVTTESLGLAAPANIKPGTCAYDSAGNFLWHSDQTGGSITVDDEGYPWIATFGGAYQLDTAGTPPEIVNIIGSPHFPQKIALDSNLNVYLSEAYQGWLAHYTLLGYQETIGTYGSALGVDPATDHLYAARGEVISEYGVGGSPTISTFGEETVASVNGISIRGSTGQVYVADNASNRIYVYTPIKDFALATTGDLLEARRNSAEVAGQVDPDGAGDISGCHVEFGTTKFYGSAAPCDQVTPYSTSREVTATLPGLLPGVTYHYRLYVTNSEGTNRGQDRTLTTPYVSDVGTDAATNVDRASITLNGHLDPEGIPTSYFFEWGLTIGYGNKAPASPASAGSGAGTTAVSTDLSGISPETTFHFRLVGVNSEGTTFGGDMSATTEKAIKGLSSSVPTDVGPDTAILNATLDPDGFDTHYYFEWGRTAAYGKITPALPGSDAGSAPGLIPVSAEVAGLDHFTTYHYRVVATNSFGSTIGDDIEFMSAPPFLPAITDTSASTLSDHVVSVSAMVNPGFGPTVFRFQYGPDTEYGARTPLSDPIAEDGSPHPVGAVIENLLPNTTYHYRAVAINFSGATLGPDRTFVTAALPGLEATSAINVTRTTALLNAQVVPNSSPTTFHFEYGTTEEYGQRTAESASIGSDLVNHIVSEEIRGLTPGTVYHFRVVATNAIGFVPSADRTFTTGPGEVSGPPPKRGCKKGFKRRKGKCVKRKRKRHHGRGTAHRNG